MRIVPRFASPDEDRPRGRWQDIVKVDAQCQLEKGITKPEQTEDHPEGRIAPNDSKAIAHTGSHWIQAENEQVTYERAAQQEQWFGVHSRGLLSGHSQRELLHPV